jgi:hypothetical protein
MAAGFKINLREGKWKYEIIVFVLLIKALKIRVILTS